MPITKLRFTNVGPFDEVDFEFDEQVNVFVGPNNSGKSTALMVLADVVVLPFVFPQKLARAQEADGVVDFNGGELTGWFPRSYSDDELTSTVELVQAAGYTLFVPALRWSSDFKAEGPLPKKPESNPVQTTVDQTARYTAAQSVYVSEWSKRNKLAVTSASVVSDEAVIQKIIELDYKAYRLNDPTIRKIVDAIATMASEITEGFPIQFFGVGEDDGLYLQFQTPDGDVPLNVLSQGTQSIIQWLAHLFIGYAEYYDYPANLEEKPGILIIDEIDAHLHPSWQRRIIPTLTKYFPNLQIFCSTHSPLMLAGLKAGQVQLLKRDDKGKVTVSRNEDHIVGWSADEILRNFLDLSSPTDLPTAEHLNRLQELRRKESLSVKEAEELELLRHTVNQDLLAGPMAAQVENIAEVLKQARSESSPPPEPVADPRARATRRRRTPSE